MSNPCRLTKLNLMFLIGTNVVSTYLILIYRTQHNFEPILEINLGIYFDNIWPGMKFHLLIRLIMIYYCEVNTLDASMFVIAWSTKNYIRTKIRFRGFQIHVTEFSISCSSSLIQFHRKLNHNLWIIMTKSSKWRHLIKNWLMVNMNSVKMMAEWWAMAD